MNQIRLEGGRLCVDPSGPLALPDKISVELLEAIFSIEDPDAVGHINDIHLRLTEADKERFEQACNTFGDPLKTMWAIAATAWASVGGQSNRWHLQGMIERFREHIHSWLVEDAILMETGIWFLVSPKGEILTQAEFEAKHGQTFEEHLELYLSFRKTVCDRLIKTMYSGFVTVEVQLELEDGRLLVDQRAGPAGIPVSEWKFGPGEKFVSTTDPAT